ncbi:ABC transporter permease [Thalassobius sp. Cn5-15]|uniref:cell division protein FtsX n=1 Tax=Thalassobius sp. Cn5-15 TaxID=2917763 RepID=UPI001EF30138|nr:FtsX-like permease family protein [Thalassobius sp. Cn5-15]MCG7493657.1 cell division protein FtsX [Thalassobius sp. Cn5-15]
MKQLKSLTALFIPDTQADRVVPPTGFTATLTTFSAAAMAFLAVFAMALTLASGRLADRWSHELARSSTLRISAPEDQMQVQIAAALKVLETTPGVASARALTADEQKALLEPFFGPDLPVEDLPIPQLIEVNETSAGYDSTGLRLRLAAEVPGAVLDDHTRWRKPLVAAAGRIRLLGWAAFLLIGGAMAAMITLAASAALSANAQVIKVLRLVGAQDSYIAGAFVRRFTYRGFVGAAIGAFGGTAAVWLLPEAETTSGFLTGLGFQGAHWLWPLGIPVLGGAVALAATRSAAHRKLKEMP